MKISFSTSHGHFTIDKWNFRSSLIDLCQINRIPHQAVSFYGRRGDSLELLVGIHHTLDEFLQKYDEIVIKPDRNIDYKNVVCLDIAIKEKTGAAAEYTFPSHGSDKLHHIEFSQEECQRYVIDKVTKFLMTQVQIDATKKIALGVSGGGDSNMLIKAFVESGIVQKHQLIGVMML